MKKMLKRTLAIFLTILMVSSSFVCFAAGLNQEAVDKHYGQYDSYLLLGDSIASGYRDEMSENDVLFNDDNNETVYSRVPGSYADIFAKAILEDDSTAVAAQGIEGNANFLAAPGFRTIEMRYMLEDDYRDACTDEYLFWTSHLYVYENMTAPDGSGEKLNPGAEYFRKKFKETIASVDLITLGIGGNDWGAYLSWTLNNILASENVADQYINELSELFSDGIVDAETLAKAVELAHTAGALPALAQKLPEALNYGLTNFYKNWDYMIQDIYDLNPDVTLMVLGMSDSGFKGKNYDYNGVEGEPVADYIPDADPAVTAVLNTIIDFIMTVGNTPMIEGSKKFGYIYVNTDGTTYVDSHPDAAGHEYIANRIIEELPDPTVSKQYSDVTPGHKNYKDIEYVVLNGIMSGVTDTTFAPDAALTTGQLNQAMNVLTGSDKSTDSTDEASLLKVAISLFAASAKNGITGFVEGFTIFFKIISSRNFAFTGTVSRAEAAQYLRTIAE